MLRSVFLRRGLSWSLAGCCLAIGCGGGAQKDKGKSVNQSKASKPEPKKPSTSKSEHSVSGPSGDKTAWKWSLPKGITEAPSVPEDNPMSQAKVELGHKLFMDKRLSVDGSRSCYSCHQNHLGNADGLKTAIGAREKALTRNSPTIWNVAFHSSLYWDGRAASLENQMLGAWKGGNMGVGAENLDMKAKEISALPEYAKSFAQVFGLESNESVKPIHFAKAISAYERTLLCGDTPVDNEQLSEAGKRGAELFRGKAGCSTCHYGVNLSDGLFHNIGIGFDKHGKLLDKPDLGRAKPSGNDADKYKFRTPSLRNVAQTAPYFHDGSVGTLEEAVRFMANGANSKVSGLDPLLRNHNLSTKEIGDIVTYLQGLSCPGTLKVIGDQRVSGIPEPHSI